MLELLLVVLLCPTLVSLAGALPYCIAWVALIRVWVRQLHTWLQSDSPESLVCLTTFFPQHRTSVGVEARVLRSRRVRHKQWEPKAVVPRCRSKPARHEEVPRVLVLKVLPTERICMML